MFAFMENKAKADIKIFETMLYTEPDKISGVIVDVSQYIDDADNYVILSWGQFVMLDGGALTSPMIDKWYYSAPKKKYKAIDNSPVVEDVTIPEVKLYNLNSARRIEIQWYNGTNAARRVKARVVLMRVGDVITL